jgi:predicted  nucleic acid-binding Zn-ribbon protein
MTASESNPPIVRLRNLPPVLREPDDADRPAIRVMSVSANQSEPVRMSGPSNSTPPPTIHAPSPDATSTANHANHGNHGNHGNHANQAVRPNGSREAFLAPRVLDQRAFDELAGTLRSLIDEAGSSRASLEQAMQRIGDGDVYASKASEHLQDRLRLSARMLKAFQGQIERAEHSAERLTKQESVLSSLLGRVEAAQQRDAERMDDAADAFRARLDAIAEQSASAFANRLRDRQNEFLAINDRLEAITPKLEALERQVEAADDQLQTLRSADAKRRDAFERAAAGAEATAHRCYDAQRTLAEHLNETDARIEQQFAHSRRVSDDINALIERQERIAETTRQRLDSQYARIDPCFIETLQSLLDQLEPWTALVDINRDLAGQKLPAPFAIVIDRLRRHVERDLVTLATTMHSLADQMTDRLAPIAHTPATIDLTDDSDVTDDTDVTDDRTDDRTDDKTDDRDLAPEMTVFPARASRDVAPRTPEVRPRIILPVNTPVEITTMVHEKTGERIAEDRRSTARTSRELLDMPNLHDMNGKNGKHDSHDTHDTHDTHGAHDMHDMHDMQDKHDKQDVDDDEQGSPVSA